MDDRQRQFAQFASAISQFAGANPVSSERNSRDRVSDGRSSTGSTSSGSSSVVSNNGGNAMAAAVAAAAAVGSNPAVWGDLNRAFQYGAHPGFPSGIPWPPTHQNKQQRGSDYHRLASFGNYNDGMPDVRNPESRLEGRRVPSKGETKATPPLPSNLGANMGPTLASLQQLVGISNEDVYRSLLAQKYPSPFSIPPSSRAQISPQTSHSVAAPSQHHSAQVSRHQSVEHSTPYQYHSQMRPRSRVSPPLSSGSPPLMNSSPNRTDGSINGEFMDGHHRDDNMSPISQHPNMQKARSLESSMLQISSNLMPSKMSVSPVDRTMLREERDMHYTYENDRQFPTSRLSDGIRSGSESESDQRSRHRRKQHQPRRQSVIYASNTASHSQGASMSADSSSDDSQECDMLLRGPLVNHVGQRPCSPSRMENPVSSMSSAMSHALSHPFLAPHLNPPERPLSNPALNDKCASPHVNSIAPTETLDLKPTSPPSCVPHTLNAVQRIPSPDPNATHVSPAPQASPLYEQETLPSDSPVNTSTSSNALESSTEIPSDETDAPKPVSPTPEQPVESPPAKADFSMMNGNKNPEPETMPDESPEKIPRELVNGDVSHLEREELKSPDVGDEFTDPNKRRTRQKRPVSYVEDETDPVLETNDYLTPSLSPTRKRGRKSKEKSDVETSFSGRESLESNGPSDGFPDKRDDPSVPSKDSLEYSNNNNHKGDELYAARLDEPLRVETEFSPLPLSSASSVVSELHSPDVYDFNDPDCEASGKGRRGRRGRRRGSPKKHGRATPEFTRSCVSPRMSQTSRSPKFFMNSRSPEALERPKQNTEESKTISTPQGTVEEKPADTDMNAQLDEIELKLAEMHSEKIAPPVYPNSTEPLPTDTLSTISPTKLANLRDSTPMESFKFGVKPTEASKNDIPGPTSSSSDLDSPEKQVDPKEPLKSPKRGRPRGSRTRSCKQQDPDSPLKNESKDCSLEDLSSTKFTGIEQHVTVGVVEILPKQRGKRGRKRRKSNNTNRNEKVPEPPPPVPHKQEEKKDPIVSHFPQIKVRKLETLCDINSFPRCLDSDMEAKVDGTVHKAEGSDQYMQANPKDSVDPLALDLKQNNKEPEAETLEDIAKFLEDTAPSTSSMSSSREPQPSTSSVNEDVASTSGTSYKDSRPKRTSRPPQDLSDGEMNSILCLMNMEDEESDDEDYIPKDINDADLDSNESESRSTDSDSESDDSDDEPVLEPRKTLPDDKSKAPKKKSSKDHKVKKSRDTNDGDRTKRRDEKPERRNPFVKICEEGGPDRIVNTLDDLRESRKKAIPFHIDQEPKNYRVGYNSTLHPNYDAFTKDLSWYCAFCKMFSHQMRLGDLYGPMFVEGLSLVKRHTPLVVNGQVEPSSTAYPDLMSSPRSRSKRTPRHESTDADSKNGRSSNLKNPDKCTGGVGSRIGVSPTHLHSKMRSPVKNANHVTPESSSANRPPGTECWMHGQCILWAPGVRVINSKLLGLDEAVIEAQQSICVHCKESGATIGCLGRGCTQIVHIPCAQLCNWSLDSEKFFSHCPLHLPTKEPLCAKSS